jgi:membrane-bound lytic murein transglycosylase D
MAMDPAAYGFKAPEADTLDYDEVNVKDCIDFSTLAQCAESDATTIHDLNPALLRWCTPPGSNGYTLRIPLGKAEVFEENYAALPDDAKKNRIEHKIRRRETLASIARKYGITPVLLADANHMAVAERLVPGKILAVPVPASVKIYQKDLVEEDAHPRYASRYRKHHIVAGRAGTHKVTYRIKPGDSLGQIAEEFGVRAGDLRAWNDIRYRSHIRAGNELVLWLSDKKSHQAIAEKTKVLPAENNRGVIAANNTSTRSGQPISYRVRKGDTLYAIASTFGVSVSDLKAWNKIRGHRLKIGQEIRINS